MESKSKRPLGITIIIIYFVLEGIFYFYTNSFDMFGGKDMSFLFRGTAAENAISAASLGFTIFNFVMVWAFIERKTWARNAAIVVLSVAACASWSLSIMNYSSTFESIVITTVSAIIVIYLLKPKTREYFAESIAR